MPLFNLIRRLTILGAVVVVFSFTLGWGIITIGNVTTSDRPLSVLIVGFALLILSFLPAARRWRNILTLVLIVASIVAGVVILWSMTQTILQVTQLNTTGVAASFGPGPIVSLVGIVLYVIGVIALMQSPHGRELETNYVYKGFDRQEEQQEHNQR